MRFRLPATFALALTVACSTFPSIPNETCGNAVVEPENGEYCDTFAQGETAACRPAGSPGACHFDCDPSKSHACPPGLGCGADFVCRAASGQFGSNGPTMTGPDALRLSFADFDADRRQDLVVESVSDLRVDYFDEAFASTTTFRLPVARAHAVPAYLTGSNNADLVLTGGTSVDVWRGQNDRTFAPTVFPSFPIPGTAERLIPIEALPQNPGRELFIFVPTAIARVTGNTSQPEPLFKVDGGPDLIAGEIAVAGFDESASSPCDELALAITGQSKVHVYTACRADAKGAIELNAPPSGAGDTPQRLLPDIVLPQTANVRGLRAGHVDGDAHVDLLIDTSQGVFVAYGAGDGTFVKVVEWKPSFDDGVPFVAQLPLAIGDLNADGKDDLVLPPGIVLYVSDGVYSRAISAPQFWTWGRIGDLDGTGRGSVVASSGSILDVYKSTGTALFNHDSFTTNGPAAFLSIGDFDGDLVDDVAMRTTVTDESGPTTSHDELTILFGTPFGYPEPPIAIGRLPEIIEIAVGPYEAALTGNGVNVDGIADIAVVVREADKSLVVAALAGRADRQLTSPFALVNAKDPTLVDRADHPQAFTTAQVSVDSGGPAVMCVAADPAGGAGSLPTSRLWIAPLTTPDADTLSVESKSVAPVGDTFSSGLDFDRAQMDHVAMTAEQGVGETTLVLVPPLGVATAGALVVATRKPEGWSVVPNAYGGDAAFRDWRLVTCDVDGDGDRDVVTLTGGAKGSAQREVRVVWNDRSGALDVTKTVVVDATLTAPAAIACANLDGDAAFEIVILTPTGAYASKWNASSSAFGAPAPIDRVAGGRALAAADFDGDGVQDLAVASTRGVSLYPGVPAIK